MNLIIAANWKMHKSAAETRAFCQALKEAADQFNGVDVVICPPFTALEAAASVLQDSSVSLGAQNMHYGDKGAFTGEIAPLMLLEHGVEYVIIGHSERRQYFGEDSDLIAKKVRAALKAGLKPILCLGETESERQQGLTGQVLQDQLAGALKGFRAEDCERLVIAYEPVWAIGSGQAAAAADAEKAGQLIKNFFQRHFGAQAAAAVRIQYGGSVNAENIGQFVSRDTVDGALVGGASLEAESFCALLKAAGNAVLS